MNRAKVSPEEDVPEEFRCKRSDGKQWRCPARAMENKTLCEKHHNQARKRGSNPPVANTSPKKMRCHDQLRTSDNKSKGFSKTVTVDATAQSKSKAKGQVAVAVTTNNDQKSVKDSPNDLLKIAKRTDDSFKMSKSPSSNVSIKEKALQHLDGGIGGPDVDENQQSKTCHQCQRSDKEDVICCEKCGKKRYCIQCIVRWYPGMSENDVRLTCPYCRGNCNCKACFEGDRSIVSFQDKMGDMDNVKFLHYLFSFIQPLLEQLHQEQCKEIDIEAKCKGDVKIERLKLMKNELLYCDNCSTSIIDVYRSCPSCSYNLCLTCCSELRFGLQPGGEKASSAKQSSFARVTVFSSALLDENGYKLPDWPVYEDKSIACPHSERGGCGSGVLVLMRICKPDWIPGLVDDVNQILAMDSGLPFVPGPCYDCSNGILSSSTFTSQNYATCTRHASNRTREKDNYLYCPTVKTSKKEDLHHFQKHWFQGEPVIVRNVVNHTAGLSWEPSDIWHTVNESMGDKFEGEINPVQAFDCLNCCQVDVDIHQFLRGYYEGHIYKDGLPELLQLKDWPPAFLFDEGLSRHAAEFISALPFHEYTHPKFGIINLVSKLPDYILKPDLGPRTCITYGIREELGQGDSVTRLHCDPYDVVNVVTHATDVKLHDSQKWQLDKTLGQYGDASTPAGDKEWPNNGTPVHAYDTSNLKREIHGQIDEDKLDVPRRDYGNLKCDSEVNNNSMIEEFSLDEKSFTSCKSSGMGTMDCDGKENEQSDHKVVGYSDGAVLWDIFRHQDSSKLQDFLQQHLNEFQLAKEQCMQHLIHPFHDQTIYLTEQHKRMLKEEYGVEPWSFEQNVGEAVFIPAGCPYQVRNVKSCMQVAIGFVSPENLQHCVRIAEELRLLPKDHHAKEDKLEIKRMMLYVASKAVKDMKNLLSSSGSGAISGPFHYGGSKTSEKVTLRMNQQRREYVLG